MAMTADSYEFQQNVPSTVPPKIPNDLNHLTDILNQTGNDHMPASPMASQPNSPCSTMRMQKRKEKGRQRRESIMKGS
jgi:hypothetical protein